jgi:hypothetical protein
MNDTSSKDELIKKWEVVLNDMYPNGLKPSKGSIFNNTFKVIASTILSPDLKSIDENELNGSNDEN